MTSEQAPASAASAAAAVAAPVSEERPGLRSIALRGAAVATLVVADLWSKAAVFAWLADKPLATCHEHRTQRVRVWPRVFDDWLAFMLSRNPGMAWGFDKLPPRLLVGGRIAAVGFLAWLVVRAPRRRLVLTTALVLILAGALGNLYDNLFLRSVEGRSFGEVRDFIDVYFKVWDWHFPTFNVADSCITVGAVLLFVSSFSKGARR